MPRTERESLREAVKAQQEVIRRAPSPYEPFDEIENVAADMRREGSINGGVSR